MVISLDKFTAVKMYDKVQRLWRDEIKNLRGLVKDSINDIEKARFNKIIEYMKSVVMAVIISDPRADIERFEKSGLDLTPHIKRLDMLDENGHDERSESPVQEKSVLFRLLDDSIDQTIIVNNYDGFIFKDHKAEYKIVQKGKTWDLSKIDFDKLKENYKKTEYKNIEIAEFRRFLQRKLL